MYGIPALIIISALFIALPVHFSSAQWGSAEQISCTNAGGNYYLNVDCNAGGLPPEFMSSCWICDMSSAPAQCPSGYTGTPPNCTDPNAFCCSGGYCGLEPQCVVVINFTCADFGQVGTWPNCTDPTPTCSNGSSGPYPACPIGPVCAANATESCSFSNSCGITNYGTVNCDGTCSVGTPAESLCVPAYSQGTYYSEGTYYSQSSYAPSCTAPRVSITATPSRVRSGQTTTLTVTGTGITTSCTVTGPGVNTTIPASSCGVSRTITTPAITTSSIYNVSCDSSAASAKVIVNIPFNIIEF